MACFKLIGESSVYCIHVQLYRVLVTDFDLAGLHVEREVENVDVAGGHEHTARLPVYDAVVRDQHSYLLELLNHVLSPNNRQRQQAPCTFARLQVHRALANY